MTCPIVLISRYPMYFLLYAYSSQYKVSCSIQASPCPRTHYRHPVIFEDIVSSCEYLPWRQNFVLLSCPQDLLCITKPQSISVLKSSWQLVQRLATGLDHNWSQLDCNCQLPSLPKIKKTGCGLVATGLFEDHLLGPWSPHSGAYTLFSSYFYLFIWIY